MLKRKYTSSSTFTLPSTQLERNQLEDILKAQNKFKNEILDTCNEGVVE